MIKVEKTLANTILADQWFVTIEQTLNLFFTVSSRLVTVAQDPDSPEYILEFPPLLIGLEKRLLKIKNLILVVKPKKQSSLYLSSSNNIIVKEPQKISHSLTPLRLTNIFFSLFFFYVWFGKNYNYLLFFLKN